MRIICEKGFYKFFPQEVGDIKRFEAKTGYSLVQSEDYFTFPVLAALPNFSIVGQPYSGLIVGLKNYAGKREEVMAQNGLTYHVKLKRLLLASSFAGFTKMKYDYSNFIVMGELPQAYFYDDSGLITGFSCVLDLKFMRFKIERFFYSEIN